MVPASGSPIALPIELELSTPAPGVVSKITLP
jgi:hypothetical protein